MAHFFCVGLGCGAWLSNPAPELHRAAGSRTLPPNCTGLLPKRSIATCAHRNARSSVTGLMATLPEPEAIAAAACWVRDGLTGRHESGSAALLKKSRWDRLAHEIRTSEGWEWLLLLAGCIVCALAFAEDAQSVHGRCAAGTLSRAQGTLTLAVEVAALSLYWADLAMKRGKLKGWHRLYVGAVAALTADAFVGLACGERPFRVLRPLLIGLRVKEQRRILQGIVHLFARQLGLAMAVTISGVVLTGALGVHLFEHHQHPSLRGAWGVGGGVGGDVGGGELDPFRSVWAASLEMWVLISSAENFRSLLLPTMTRSGRGVGGVGGGDGAGTSSNFAPMLFFGPVVYFGYFFVMSVLLAVVVDEYLLSARRLMANEKHKERKGLLKAFALLDPANTGTIGLHVTTALLRELHPAMSEREAKLRYFMMAGDKGHGVTIVQFLKIGTNLSYRLDEWRPEEEGRRRLPSLPPKLRIALLALSALLFCVHSPQHSPTTARRFFALHTATLPPLLLDSASWAARRRLVNAVCLGGATASAVIYWLAAFHSRAPPWPSAFAGQLCLLCLLARASSQLRVIGRLLSYVLVPFVSVTVTVSLVVYVFALIGMQAFPTVLLAPLPPPAHTAHAATHDAATGRTPDTLSTIDPLSALGTLGVSDRADGAVDGLGSAAVGLSGGSSPLVTAPLAPMCAEASLHGCEAPFSSLPCTLLILFQARRRRRRHRSPHLGPLAAHVADEPSMQSMTLRPSPLAAHLLLASGSHPLELHEPLGWAPWPRANPPCPPALPIVGDDQ